MASALAGAGSLGAGVAALDGALLVQVFRRARIFAEGAVCSTLGAGHGMKRKPWRLSPCLWCWGWLAWLCI